MNKRDNRTHRMVALAMMGAIVVLLANTPLGLIQLPVIKATTVHIPVRKCEGRTCSHRSLE